MKEAPLQYAVIITVLVLLFCGNYSEAAEKDCLWGEWIIDEPPTCISVGYRHRTCIRDPNAPHTETEIIPMLSHDYEIAETAPTCIQRGIRTYTCKRCNDTYIEEFGIYAGHQYQLTSTKNPTCTAEGEYTYTCTVCNDVYTESIPKSEHKYNISIEKTPDCQSPGIKKYECIDCHESYTEMYGELQDHVFEELTEEKDGYKVICLKCKVCGEKQEIQREEIIPSESFEPETKEEPAMIVENTIMALLNIIAIVGFTIWLVPDFKVLKWHKKMKKESFINKPK